MSYAGGAAGPIRRGIWAGYDRQFVRFRTNDVHLVMLSHKMLFSTPAHIGG